MSGLPGGWLVVPLESIAVVQLGRQRSPKNHVGPNMRPYLRAANVTWEGLALADVKSMHFSQSEVGTFRLEQGDILLAEASGSADQVGKPAIWQEEIAECCFQNTLLRVRTFYMDRRYLLWFFKWLAISGAFAKSSRGVGIHHLGANALSAWPIPVPPLAEQERIVAAIEEELSRIDVGAAALERVRHNLKRMRSSVLEEAIGRDWPQRPLDEVCVSVTDGDHQPPPQTSSGIPFLVIGNVRSGRIDFSDCRKVPVHYYRSLHPKRRPQRGDVLYTVVGSYGIPVLVEDDEPFCVQRHIAILRPSDKIDPRYLQYALASGAARRQADSCATGTAQMTVPLSGLRRLTIGIPPIDEQCLVATELDGVERAVDRVLSEIRRQTSRSDLLRSALLASAFSGKLVPQNPSDERASSLLERIAAERASSIGQKPIRARSHKPRTTVPRSQHE